MPNTVRLSALPTIAGGKLLADVQAGSMTMSDYLTALGQSSGTTAGWTPQGDYLIDFARGIADPSGAPLDILEVLQVVNALMPSPLRSAGKTIRLRGPMPGAVAAHVSRICYAANIVIEILDRSTGMIREVPITALERDRVRLVRPDTTERTRSVGNGWVIAETTQVTYRRRDTAVPFQHAAVLELVFIETNARRSSAPRAQVSDGRYYGWVDALEHLEDVVV